jgi:hypothetical protein
MFAVVIPLLVAIVIAVVGLVLRLGLGAFGLILRAVVLSPLGGPGMSELRGPAL